MFVSSRTLLVKALEWLSDLSFAISSTESARCERSHPYNLGFREPTPELEGVSEHELVDVIENGVDALSGLAADTTGPPSCWHFREPIVVASALFCKDCGVKLIDIARLAQVG